MDKQLACATYATLIPVFMLAGYFGSEGLRRAKRIRAIPAVLVLLVAGAVGEIFAILGVGATATSVQVAVSGVAAIVMALAMFLAIAATLVDMLTEEHPREPAQGDGSSGGEGPDKG